MILSRRYIYIHCQNIGGQYCIVANIYLSLIITEQKGKKELIQFN